MGLQQHRDARGGEGDSTAATKQSYFRTCARSHLQTSRNDGTRAYERRLRDAESCVGYQRERRQRAARRNNIFMHVIRGGPAGGGYSTVEDVLRFDGGVALREAGQPEVRRSPYDAKTELQSPAYGYGFGVFDGGKIVGHSGGFPGISSNLDIYLTSGYTTVVLSNYGGGSMPVVRKARTLLAQ